MPELLQLVVATPERELVRADVEEVQIPARSGYVGILPGHAPLLGELGTGFLSYGAGSRRWYVAVQGGFLEVSSNHVRVLATAAERAEEIDVERTRAALKAAQDQLVNPALGVDPAVALESVEWAEARLATAEKK